MPTIGDIANIMNTFAPEHTAYNFDNVGLLVGDASWPVNSLLLALDVTPEIVQEAISRGAQMIITHHPLIFSPLKSITANTPEGQMLLDLISNKVALYASHTPLDAAAQGVNDTLCQQLGLSNMEGFELMYEGEGQKIYCCRIGMQDTPIEFSALVNRVKTALNPVCLKVVPPKKERVQRIAVCCGAGGISVNEVINLGADVFITGELEYHDALLLAMHGIGVIEAGHYETEAPVINSLFKRLQNELNRLQYNVKVMQPMTCTNPYKTI